MKSRRAASPASLVLGALISFSFLFFACRTDAPKTTEPAAATTASAPQAAPIVYPVAERGAQVDTMHGVAVADPYRALEDPDAPKTRVWIEAQNRITNAYLTSIPERETIRKRLTELWDYERFGLPYREGSRYFIAKNDGLQNQSVVYVSDGLEATPRVLLDPNTLSKDGTVALTTYTATNDGKLLCYGISDGGSDWTTWRVRDVATGKDLDDRIEWAKFARASWRRDGKGFYYSRYDAPKAGDALKGENFFHKLYWHELGTPQSADALVYERKDQKEWQFSGETTDDGRYLIIRVSKGTLRKHCIFYKDLSVDHSPVIELISDFSAAYDFIGNDGPTFWLNTNLDAPRGRLIAINTNHPERAQWKEVVPQQPETLTAINYVGGHFLALYLKDAHTIVRDYDHHANFKEVPLPGIGTIEGFGGEPDNPESFYSFTSFTDPGAIYRYDVTTGQSTLFRRPKVKFDPDAYETKQVFYTSKDGTRIPMFIVHKKGLALDGNNPTLLYGYGGFNISLTPAFSVTQLVWMDMGGVYAVPNLRGGGEYGEEWHQSGTKLKKQNVFDDYIAAAEWLIANKYTTPARLASSGGSNGGLLVAACELQRPDLYRACIPAVGVLDMLRYHKWTIGWAWMSDYGSPEDPQEFAALYAYSPYHRCKPGVAYPATLITTADHDDRVFPAHSFKFAAALQAAQSGPHPILIRIETRAGHGAGKPTTKRIEEAADRLGFLVRELSVG